MVLQMHDIPLPPEGEELLLSTPWYVLQSLRPEQAHTD